MGSRYKCNILSGWIVNEHPAIKLAPPSPKTKATVMASESQPVQKDEEIPPSPVKDIAISDKLSFQQDDLDLISHLDGQPRTRTRYTSAFPSNWTTTQDTSVTQDGDGPQTSRDIDQSDEPRSSSGDEAYIDWQSYPPHQGPYIGSLLGQLQEVSEGENAIGGPARRSGHPLAPHSRNSAVQRRARSRQRDTARQHLSSPSASSAKSTNSPQSRAEASVGAPSVSPAYAFLPSQHGEVNIG